MESQDLTALMAGVVYNNRDSALVLADAGRPCDEALRALTAVGHRVARYAPLADALDCLTHHAGASLIVADFGLDETVDEAMVLARLSTLAHDRTRPVIANCPPAALDRIAARFDAPFATLTCDATMAERVSAITVATAPATFHDVKEESVNAERLQSLADEVARIARALSGLAGDDPRPAHSDWGSLEPQATTFSDGMIGYRAEPTRAAPTGHETIRAEDIRTMIRLRRQREYAFGSELFADPAWDMMLDLMAARIERLRVAVSSLCIAAAVPPTTALRWIKTLTDMGVFRRVADPTDGRRIFIELSDPAAQAVLGFLGDAKRAQLGVL